MRRLASLSLSRSSARSDVCLRAEQKINWHRKEISIIAPCSFFAFYPYQA